MCPKTSKLSLVSDKHRRKKIPDVKLKQISSKFRLPVGSVLVGQEVGQVFRNGVHRLEIKKQKCQTLVENDCLKISVYLVIKSNVKLNNKTTFTVSY